MTARAAESRSRFARIIRSHRAWLVLLFVLAVSSQAFAWWQFRAARAALDADAFDDAEQALARCRAVWPWGTRESVRIAAARAAWRAGDTARAMVGLRAARRAAGTTTDAIAFEWALVQAADGNVQEVAEYLQERTTTPELERLAWEALGAGYLATYRANDAYTVARLWLDKRPDDMLAMNLRGRAAVQGRGRGLQLGIDDLRTVLERHPEWASTRAVLATALIDAGRAPEAVAEWERLTREQPDRPEHRIRLARCLRTIGRTADATATLNAVLTDAPDHPLALRTQGQFALGDSRPADAEGPLARAARALPGDYQTQYLYFQTLEALGRPSAASQRAVAEAARARATQLEELQTRKLAERPFDPALNAEFGALLLKSGRTAEGLRWLDDALALDPTFAPAHLALAEHFAAAGDADRATAHRRAAGQ